MKKSQGVLIFATVVVSSVAAYFFFRKKSKQEIQDWFEAILVGYED